MTRPADHKRTNAERKTIAAKLALANRLRRDKKRFGPMERLVGLEIFDKMYGARISAWARHKDLADKLGCGSRTVESAVSKLKQFGYMRTRFDGSNLRTIYTLLLDGPNDAAPPPKQKKRARRSAKAPVDKPNGSGAQVEAIRNSNTHQSRGDPQPTAAPIRSPLRIEASKEASKEDLACGESPTGALADAAGAASRARATDDTEALPATGRNQGLVEMQIVQDLGEGGFDRVVKFATTKPDKHVRLCKLWQVSPHLARASDDYHELLEIAA